MHDNVRQPQDLVQRVESQMATLTFDQARAVDLKLAAENLMARERAAGNIVSPRDALYAAAAEMLIPAPRSVEPVKPAVSATSEAAPEKQPAPVAKLIPNHPRGYLSPESTRCMTFAKSGKVGTAIAFPRKITTAKKLRSYCDSWGGKGWYSVKDREGRDLRVVKLDQPKKVKEPKRFKIAA